MNKFMKIIFLFVFCFFFEAILAQDFKLLDCENTEIKELYYYSNLNCLLLFDTVKFDSKYLILDSEDINIKKVSTKSYHLFLNKLQPKSKILIHYFNKVIDSIIFKNSFLFFDIKFANIFRDVFYSPKQINSLIIITKPFCSNDSQKLLEYSYCIYDSSMNLKWSKKFKSNSFKISNKEYKKILNLFSNNCFFIAENVLIQTKNCKIHIPKFILHFPVGVDMDLEKISRFKSLYHTSYCYFRVD